MAMASTANMKIVIIVIISAIACAYAGDLLDLGSLDVGFSKGTLSQKYYPLTANDQKASKNGGAYIRDQLVGPVFNPFTTDELNPFHYTGTLFSATVTPTNLVVEGAKSAKLESDELRMKDPIRADANGTLPQIVINADLKIDAKIGVLPELINGHMKAVINNLGLNGVAVQAVPSSGVYAVQSCQFQAHVDNVQVQLTLDKHKEFENNSEMMKQLLQDQKDAIATYIAEFAIEVVNNLLSKTSVEEVNRRLLK